MGCGVEPRVELALRRTLFFSFFVFAYLIFGAFVFSILPRRHQPLRCEKNAEKLDAQRSEMLNVLWAETMAQSEHDWALMANQKFDMYERALLGSCTTSETTLSQPTFLNAFLQSYSLITTIGFQEADSLTAVGKLFAMAYAVVGIPLALLYLGQCSKIVAGLLPGGRVLGAAFAAIFVATILYDITEGSDDDTPFIDALFNAFLTMSTVGSCSMAPSTAFAFISLIAMSLVSISYVVLERHIEKSVQGFELSFSRLFGSVGRWMSSKGVESDRIIEEEEEEETEDSES